MPSHHVRTRTRTKVLVDTVRESPVDHDLLRTRRRALLVLVLLAIPAIVASLY